MGARERVRPRGWQVRPASRRVRRLWTPRWESPFSTFAAKYAETNVWRTYPFMDLADLLQEAYVVFLETRERYPRAVEPKHFMALYKLLMRSRFSDIAALRQGGPWEMKKWSIGGGGSGGIGEDGEALDWQQIEDPNGDAGFADVDLDLLIADAPPEVAAIVHALERVPERFRGFLRGPSGRETAEDRLQRLCGYPGGNLLDKLARFFSPGYSNRTNVVLHV